MGPSLPLVYLTLGRLALDELSLGDEHAYREGHMALPPEWEAR